MAARSACRRLIVAGSSALSFWISRVLMIIFDQKTAGRRSSLAEPSMGTRRQACFDELSVLRLAVYTRMVPTIGALELERIDQ